MNRLGVIQWMAHAAGQWPAQRQAAMLALLRDDYPPEQVFQGFAASELERARVMRTLREPVRGDAA